MLINQINNIENLIHKFNMCNAKGCGTPADVNVQLCKIDNECH